jgi:hypothetical protein
MNRWVVVWYGVGGSGAPEWDRLCQDGGKATQNSGKSLSFSRPVHSYSDSPRKSSPLELMLKFKKVATGRWPKDRKLNC